MEYRRLAVRTKNGKLLLVELFLRPDFGIKELFVMRALVFSVSIDKLCACKNYLLYRQLLFQDDFVDQCRAYRIGHEELAEIRPLVLIGCQMVYV